MDFSNKCEILGNLWLFYREDIQGNEAWEAFFEYNDIALPLAYMLMSELTSAVNDDGREYIEQTWLMFCDYIEIDPDGEYETISDAFEASERPPLEV